MRSALVILLAATPALADGPFWAHWSDGRAELSGYELVQPRYGELRRGRAVLVYVTEPFSRSRGVKVDRFDPNDADHLTALKLNHVRKFQTGIYDYSVMTSVFVDPARGFAPLKVSFSSQEWCGHVYEEASFGAQATVALRSYFEGETADTEVAATGSEDALFVTLRGLAAETLDPSEARATVLPAALDRRLRHKVAAPHDLRVRWAKAPETVTVPAGAIPARKATWERGVGGACDAWIEVAYPHRIVQWRCTDGEEAKLLGTERIPYWRTHGEGDEALLEKLGLRPLRVAP